MITKLNILKAYLEQKYARDKRGLMRSLQKTVNEYYTSEAIALLSSASIFKNNMTETDLKRCIAIKYLSNKNFDAFYQSIIHANETTYRNNPKLFDAILKGISNEA